MSSYQNQIDGLLERIQEKQQVLDAPRKVLGDITNNPNWREKTQHELNKMIQEGPALTHQVMAKTNQLEPLDKVINYLRNRSVGALEEQE